jgi:hypothetical protein
VYIQPGKASYNSKGKLKKFDQKAGSISIVDFYGNILLNCLIYRKQGTFRENPHSKNVFTKNSLDNSKPRTDNLIAIPLQEVQQKVMTLLEDKIIVGCDMANDFASLEIPFGEYSKQSFDLQWHYYDEAFSSNKKPIIERWSLKRLCKEFLNEDVQPTGQDHIASEDAINTMRIFREVYLNIIPEPVSKDSTV